MTVATTDGCRCGLSATRARGGRGPVHSTDVAKLRELHPEVEVLNRLGAETRVVVSEPLRDLSGAWNEVRIFLRHCPARRTRSPLRSGLRVRPFRLAAPHVGTLVVHCSIC